MIFKRLDTETSKENLKNDNFIKAELCGNLNLNHSISYEFQLIYNVFGCKYTSHYISS